MDRAPVHSSRSVVDGESVERGTVSWNGQPLQAIELQNYNDYVQAFADIGMAIAGEPRGPHWLRNLVNLPSSAI